MRSINTKHLQRKFATASLLAVSALSLSIPAVAFAQTAPPDATICVSNGSGSTEFVDASRVPAGFSPCSVEADTDLAGSTTTTTPNPENTGAVEADNTTAAANTNAAPASTLADTAATNDGLAFTGADIAGMTGIGLILIAVGGGFLVARRRNATNNNH